MAATYFFGQIGWLSCKNEIRFRYSFNWAVVEVVIEDYCKNALVFSTHLSLENKNAFKRKRQKSERKSISASETIYLYHYHIVMLLVFFESVNVVQ